MNEPTITEYPTYDSLPEAGVIPMGVNPNPLMGTHGPICAVRDWGELFEFISQLPSEGGRTRAVGMWIPCSANVTSYCCGTASAVKAPDLVCTPYRPQA